jgi:acyl-CoA thioesterase I
MNKAGWRHAFIYGCTLLLCQPLVACGSAERSEASPKDSETALSAPTIPADAPLVIAFGDSLYAGYRLAPNEGLAPQLQAALIADGVTARVQNAGVSGDTTAAGLARLDFVLDSGKQKPALVVLGLGGNDMLRGISPDQTRANIDAMLANLSRRKIPVLLTGMVASPNMGADYAAAFNPIYPELASKYGASLYPFILDGVATVPGMQLDDDIHPNAKGVAVMAKALAPLVEEALPGEP